MKRKTADIASFFSKEAVRKKKPAEAQKDRQGEQTDETDSESEREECPVSGVVPSQLPGIQTLSHMHLAIVLPSTMSSSVLCSYTGHVSAPLSQTHVIFQFPKESSRPTRRVRVSSSPIPVAQEDLQVNLLCCYPLFCLLNKSCINYVIKPFGKPFKHLKI